MHLYEKCVYSSEVAEVVDKYVAPDQFAYQKGHNSNMALIKAQHMWLKHLHERASSASPKGNFNRV